MANDDFLRLVYKGKELTFPLLRLGSLIGGGFLFGIGSMMATGLAVVGIALIASFLLGCITVCGFMLVTGMVRS